MEVGAANTTVGLGSTSYEVTGFTLENSGYNFKVGDVFKPVGLVTDRFLNTSSLISDFELTVLDVFRDQYSSWNFGEFDYIDSIKDLQNGQRKRFPLIYNSNLLSFEVDTDNPDSSLIDLDALLLIFVNGVVQDPGESYTFEGGTSFEFTQAPDGDDNITTIPSFSEDIYLKNINYFSKLSICLISEVGTKNILIMAFFSILQILYIFFIIWFYRLYLR